LRFDKKDTTKKRRCTHHVFKGDFFNKSLTEIGNLAGTQKIKVCLSSPWTHQNNNGFRPELFFEGAILPQRHFLVLNDT